MSKKKKPAVEIWNVRRWDTGQLLGQVKDANIDIALFLARKKWGHGVTVDNLHDNYPRPLVDGKPRWPIRYL